MQVAGFRHGTKERFERFEPLWGAGVAPTLASAGGSKPAQLASELDAWDRLCGEEEAAMQSGVTTGPGLTEAERQPRRKSHTPAGRHHERDMAPFLHSREQPRFAGPVSPCAQHVLFQSESRIVRDGAREGGGSLEGQQGRGGDGANVQGSRRQQGGGGSRQDQRVSHEDPRAGLSSSTSTLASSAVSPRASLRSASEYKSERDLVPV